MLRPRRTFTTIALVLVSLAAFATKSQPVAPKLEAPDCLAGISGAQRFNRLIRCNARSQMIEGRQTFRYDTFGDEVFWGDTLRLHDAIKGEAAGGVGAGLSPQAALDLGLKVAATALPSELLGMIRSGQLDLDDPANTVELLRQNAVVGVTGFFDEAGALISVGIQCALCHSTVDNSVGPGVGHRLDGKP